MLVYDRVQINLPILSTATWVPPTFAVAGVVMSALYLMLDDILLTAPNGRRPRVPRVLQGISLFSFRSGHVS